MIKNEMITIPITIATFSIISLLILLLVQTILHSTDDDTFIE